MSEPKHTPGPWMAGRYHGIVDSSGKPVYFRCVTTLMNGNPAERANADANNCLAIAAPCLLARLESMAAQHACGCGHPACKRCADDRMNQKVIERAKGGAEWAKI